MNVVVDTNILISAVLWTGAPFEALTLLLNKYSLAQSLETLDEFENILRREKFRKILQKRNLHSDIIVETLIKKSKYFTVSKKNVLTAKKSNIEDSGDLKFLELAIEACAQWIISGDKHLLKLKEFENIKILTVKEFLDIHKKTTP